MRKVFFFRYSNISTTDYQTSHHILSQSVVSVFSRAILSRLTPATRFSFHVLIGSSARFLCAVIDQYNYLGLAVTKMKITSPFVCQTAWHFSSGVSFDTPVYPRLTWLGSIGRAHGDATLKRLQNWHSKTRFQVFMCSRSNWGLEVVLLKTRRAKQEHQEKITLSKEETNKKADPTRRRHWHLNPDHTGGGRVLCSPTPTTYFSTPFKETFTQANHISAVTPLTILMGPVWYSRGFDETKHCPVMVS